MFSLYVCDIPQNITKEELEKVFSQFNGFHEVRLAKDKNRQRIAFVDYDSPQAAEYAMSATKGYRLSNSNKGITVRFSENSKNNQQQPHGSKPQKRRETSQNSVRGHQPFQSASQTSSVQGNGGSGAPVVVLNGVVNDVSGPQVVNGGPQRLGPTQNVPQQQRQLASGAASTVVVPNLGIYQPDPTQQMQQRFYQQPVLQAGNHIDLHQQNINNPQASFIDQFNVGSQFLGQIGGQQPNPNVVQHPVQPSPLFGGPGQPPHMLNQNAFPQIAPKQSDGSTSQSIPPQQKTSFDTVTGLRNPEQSIYPQPQPQQQLLQTPDLFQTQQLTEINASMDRSGQQASDFAVGAYPHQAPHPQSTGIIMPSSTPSTLLPSRLAQAVEPTPQQNMQQILAVSQQHQVGAPSDGQNQPPSAGNPNLDIYNFLTNLNSMASSMASSMVNKQTTTQQQTPQKAQLVAASSDSAAQQQFQQQQQPPPHQQTNQAVSAETGAQLLQASATQPMINNSSSSSKSQQNQIQSQLIQSLISTLQNQQQTSSAPPQAAQSAQSNNNTNNNNNNSNNNVNNGQIVGVPTPQQAQPSAGGEGNQENGNWQQPGATHNNSQIYPPHHTQPFNNQQQSQQASTSIQSQTQPQQPSQQQTQLQQQQQSQQQQQQQQSQQQNRSKQHQQQAVQHAQQQQYQHHQQQQQHQQHHQQMQGNSGLQHQQQQQQHQIGHHVHQQANQQPPKGSSLKMSVVQAIQAMFGQNTFCVPKNATNTIYVEGIPVDATEREVSHIFRPFKGYKSVRLIPREISPEEKVILCFADFDNSFQTTLVINTLQGYRFDKDDIMGLSFSYANKQGNALQQHGAKGESAKEPNPNNNNNNSIANQTVNSGSGAGHSADEASSTRKLGALGAGVKSTITDGDPKSSHSNNNTSKK